MAFIPAPDVAKVAMVQTLQGEECINVLHVKTTGSAWDTSSLEGLAVELWTWWVANIIPLQAETAILERVDATDLTTSTGPFASYAGSPATGSYTGNAAPGNVALVATLRTASRGRSYRGRMYLGGIPLGALYNSNLVTLEYATAYKTAMELLLAGGDVLGSTEIWGVLTQFAGGEPRTEGLCNEITAVNVDQPLDSQRRRLAGRGR